MTDQEKTKVKAGAKSSENITTWAIGALGGGYGLMDENPFVRAAALLAIGWVGSAYVLSRGMAKRGCFAAEIAANATKEGS